MGISAGLLKPSTSETGDPVVELSTLFAQLAISAIPLDENKRPTQSPC